MNLEYIIVESVMIILFKNIFQLELGEKVNRYISLSAHILEDPAHMWEEKLENTPESGNRKWLFSLWNIVVTPL